jgi:hypothetical protein
MVHIHFPSHDIHPWVQVSYPCSSGLLLGPDHVLDLVYGAVALSERDDPMLCNPVWLQLSQVASTA